MPRKNPVKGPQERIAAALERLIQLYELELNATGIITQEGGEEGEVLETSEELIQQKEREEDVRRKLGLAPGAHVSPIDPDTGREWALPQEEAWPSTEERATLERLFALGSSIFGYGPEGAESVERGAEEAGHPGGGPPPAAPGHSDEKVPEGEGGADSGTSALGSAEERGVAASPEA